MIYKRGKVYWYKFMWQGKLVRESTKQGNDKVARQMEAVHRTSLAKGEVGLRDKKPSPTLAAFIDNRFEPWARATFEKTSPKTWFDWYRVGLRAIKGYAPLAICKLSEIGGETIADFAAHRQTSGCQVSTVNSSLRVLRRVLRLAVEWGASESSPKVKLLTGERHRERVVTRDEESKYLAAAPVESSSLKKQHAKTFAKLSEQAAANKESSVRPFVLYSLRHTFLTRLGESGCDAWTLSRIAGHSNISMSSRYVHPSEDSVLNAMANLGGHNIGHSPKQELSSGTETKRLTQ